MTSPEGEYTSPTFGRSHALRTAENSLDHLFARARASRILTPLSLAWLLPGENIHLRRLVARTLSEQQKTPSTTFSCKLGPPGFVPLCHFVTSPQGEYTSPTFGRSHSHRTAENSLDHLFCASFGRTPNEGGGLLPPGHAAHIPLIISALGIFRVAKTTTLISVKQLIHSNLQVALQNAETLTFCFHVNLFLRFSWAKVRNHKKRVNTHPRRRLPYCRRYRNS